MQNTAIYHDEFLNYPLEAPFNPAESYPEFKFLGDSYFVSSQNDVFISVRNLFKMLDFDKENFNKSTWNPFRDMISPGETVVIKPNMVMHETNDLVGAHTLCTDSSVIRVIVDYVSLALSGRGKIIIADAPIQGADFEKLLNQLQIKEIRDYCSSLFGISIEIMDLRREWAVLDEETNQILKRLKLPGDPKGYSVIDLKGESLLQELVGPKVRFSVSDYDDEVTNKNHKDNVHKYMISNTILTADVFINVPKLKTHQKSGLTASLKNIVGINGSKDYLAHHRVGSVKQGGDEYLELNLYNYLFKETRKLLNENAPVWIWKYVRKVGLFVRDQIKKRKTTDNDNSFLIGYGGWYGNDTVWRMIYDINKILFLYDHRSKKLTNSSKRKYFTIIDGIICGEANGPLSPQSKNCGLLLAGFDALITDVICSRLMGFDWRKIPMLNNNDRLQDVTKFVKGSKLDFITNSDFVTQILNGTASKDFNFTPPPGWIGHIEKTKKNL